jgi:thioredoxin reductase (NADPH)
MSGNPTDPVDCLVVGAGPAGLTAALYLARFLRTVTVVGEGDSRAARIPRSHNIPGMAQGIGGTELLDRHIEQVGAYGIVPTIGTVVSVDPAGEGFLAACMTPGGETRITARTVLVATGVRDRDPALDDVGAAIMRGLVRHCPVCDAFEVVGQDVAVLGNGPAAVGEAVFMRTYSERVTLLMLDGAQGLAAADRDRIAAHGIRFVDDPVTSLKAGGARETTVRTRGGAEHRFDTLYAALGSDARSGFAVGAGAEREAACSALLVDAHQRTSVPGMWAAGDVVSTLNQVAVAWGHAAIAATDIHNHLRSGEPLREAWEGWRP